MANYKSKIGDLLKKIASHKGVLNIGPMNQSISDIGKKIKDLRNPIRRKRAIKGNKTGGKVYKVDNSGQQMVAKQYGGKVK